MNCDVKDCQNPVTHECHCRRCDGEDPEDRFHSCDAHAQSTAIKDKHARVYPNPRYQLSLARL